MTLSPFAIEVIGGYGTIMVLGAYALNSFGYLTARSIPYQLMNFSGGIAFVYYTLEKMAWASLFVNVVWVAIALLGLWSIVRTRRTPITATAE